MFGFKKKNKVNSLKQRLESLETVHLNGPNIGKIPIDESHYKFLDCDTANLLLAYEMVSYFNFLIHIAQTGKSDYRLIHKIRHDFYKTENGNFVKVTRDCCSGLVTRCCIDTEEEMKEAYFHFKEKILPYEDYRCVIYADNYKATKEAV